MRLILDPPASGRVNMALDEALLESVARGLVPPTLRLYSFDPPALTLGRAQPLADVALAACADAGVDVVRRPTGGRAVLHDRDLTYCVVLPIAPDETIGDSYGRLSQAIARALSSLGMPAAIVPGSLDRTRSQATHRQPTAARRPGETRERPANCFAVSTVADLVVDGRKIVGSAQVRRHGFLLQHGSIRLAPGVVPIEGLLSGRPPGRATSGAPRSVPDPSAGPGFCARPEGLALGSRQPLSIAEALGLRDPDEEWLAATRASLSRAIVAALEVAWIPARWTDPERNLARVLASRATP